MGPVAEVVKVADVKVNVSGGVKAAMVLVKEAVMVIQINEFN